MLRLVEWTVPYAMCDTHGDIYVRVNELGYDVKEFSEKYLRSDFCRRAMDSFYSCFQIGGVGYTVDYIITDEVHIEKRTCSALSNDMAYWIGFMYKYLVIALSMSSKEIVEQLPFDKMMSFYPEIGMMKSYISGRIIKGYLDTLKDMDW